MSDSQYFPSDSEGQLSPSLPHPQVSILKHLPAPLKLLPIDFPSYELSHPRCLFKHPLPKINTSTMPKVSSVGKKGILNRLLALQETFFNRQQVHNQAHQSETLRREGSLWESYKDAEVIYSRFGQLGPKEHFAGVLMSVQGISLNQKECSLPLIKSVSPNGGGIQLLFDSHFENGNLMYVFQNSKGGEGIEAYDLVLQNDTNTKGHNQWFYFKATSTRRHQKVRFNICNLVKDDSLFSYGLKPLVFSEKEYSRGLGWYRAGQRIKYCPNKMISNYSGKPYSTLSFEYEFAQANECVLFAPSFPYSYSQLLYFMEGLLKNKDYQPFLSIKKICETPSKNTVNLISISTGRRAIQETKVVWVLARQHPVQTTSSFMVEGIISYLLKQISETKEESAHFLDGYTFKIVPMVNPDGVIHGNSRAQVTGVDPNRAWKIPSKTITPAVYHIKRQILSTRSQTTLVLDLHSHSKKLGCFFYGNYAAGNTAEYRILPSMVCQKDPRFSYSNCRFRGGHERSARRVLFEELGIPNIFTVQCSLLGFVKDNRVTEYGLADYYEMGSKVLSTFFNLQRLQKLELATSYPHQLTDFCDAQSARSDSCVSLYEFPEVYKPLRAKRKPQQKKKKHQKLSSQAHKGHKAEVSKSQKGQIPSQPHRILPKDARRSLTAAREEYLVEKLVRANQSLEGEAPLLKSKYNSRHVRLLAQKRGQRVLLGPSIEDSSFCKRTRQESSVQVNHLQVLKSNNTLTQHKNRKLIVLGNGVQEDRSLNNNEVHAKAFKENAAESIVSFISRRPRIELAGRQFEEGGQGKLQTRPCRMAKLFRV